MPEKGSQTSPELAGLAPRLSPAKVSPEPLSLETELCPGRGGVLTCNCQATILDTCLNAQSVSEVC